MTQHTKLRIWASLHLWPLILQRPSIRRMASDRSNIVFRCGPATIIFQRIGGLEDLEPGLHQVFMRIVAWFSAITSVLLLL